MIDTLLPCWEIILSQGPIILLTYGISGFSVVLSLLTLIVNWRQKQRLGQLLEEREPFGFKAS